MSNRKGLFDSPEIAAMSTAARAQQLLEHSRVYRNRKQCEELIDAVRNAVERFNCVTVTPDLSEPVVNGVNPLTRLVPGPSLGFANGFLVAWLIRDQALDLITKEHGLYFSGLAALSLVQSGDPMSSNMNLFNIIEAWESGRAGRKQRKVASQPRSPFVAYVKEVTRNNPEDSAKEIWERLPDIGHEVDLNGRFLTIDVVEKDGVLYWLAYANDADKDEETKIIEGSVKWSTFPAFISKLK